MNTRRYSNRQEQLVAKKIQGKQQPNSGATKYAKGDVIEDNFLVECKTKIKDSTSITIRKDWIEKLKEECFSIGKRYWAIAINFGGLRNDENLYIISEELFIKLKNYIKEEQQ